MASSSDHPTTNLSLGGADDFQTTTRNVVGGAVRKNSSSTRRKNSMAVNNNNENQKKKKPQRGMGVAQLERLRLEERWKRITEINTTTSTPDHSMEQAGLIVHPGAGNGNGDKFKGYLYGINGNSKELSSSPKVLLNGHTDHHCAECHKKKRIISGEYLGLINGVKDKIYTHLPSNVGGFDLTGLRAGSHDLEKITSFHHAGTSGFGFYNKEQGVEVVALDKKGIGSSRMEYEFFPGCRSYESSSSSYNNEFLMMKKKKMMMIMESPEASCVTTTTTGGGGGDSTSIDLSLRLSNY